MKRFIAIILTLSFILCMIPMTLSVSAAETYLNGAGKGWTVCRGDLSFVVDSEDDYDFHIKGDAQGKTWSWPVYRKESLTQGTIEATFKGTACIGLFFGATGIKEYVGDANEKIAGTEESKVALADTAHDIRYYSACVVWEKHDNGNYKFRLHRDDSAAGSEATLGSSVSLSESVHGINGTDDFTIKLSFDGKGNLKCYVNDKLVMTRTDVVPYGDQFGVLVRNSDYGTANANQRVGYVKDFKFTDRNYFDWTPRRGAAAVAPYSEGEYQWFYQNTNVYNNPLRYNTDLEEGTVTATVTKGSKTGIIFGATGLDNVKDGTAANISSGNAPDLRFFWAYVNGSKLVLEVDSTAAAGTQSRSKIAEATLPVSSDSADYTIKVAFTKAGNIRVFFNDTLYITVTAQELADNGYEIYGSEVGMMPVALSGGTANALAGSVKSFAFGDNAPETGDNTTVFVVLALLALVSLAAVPICFTRKKIAD